MMTWLYHMTAEEHLNIEKLTALLLYNDHSFLIMYWKYDNVINNKIKNYMCANIKKTSL